MNKIIYVITVMHVFFASQASDKPEENLNRSSGAKSAGRGGPTRNKSPSSPIERLKKDHQDHKNEYVSEKQVKTSESK